MMHICRFCVLLFMCVIMAACSSATGSNGAPNSSQASATKEPEMHTTQHPTTPTPAIKNTPTPTKVATATPVPADPTPTQAPDAQQSDPTPSPDPAQNQAQDQNQAQNQDQNQNQAPAAAPVGPAGSGPYGTPPAITADENGVTQQLFNLINKDRAAEGKPAYNWNETLAGGARLHSWNMSKCGMSHACAGEADACQRVLNEGIRYMTCGENIGYSSPSPDAWGAAQGIQKLMLAEKPPEDGHRRNLLSTDFHKVGVGIYVDNKGLVWITEDFSD